MSTLQDLEGRPRVGILRMTVYNDVFITFPETKCENLFDKGWLEVGRFLYLKRMPSFSGAILVSGGLIISQSHGNLRVPPLCHVYPQEIAGLTKGLLTIGFP